MTDAPVAAFPWLRIVMVTEWDEQRALFADTLRENLGCQVQTARDGVDGLRLLADWQPDLVIVDLNIPLTHYPARMDGLTMLGIAGMLLPITSRPVLIAITSHGPYMDDARESGADQVLMKPFSGDELTQAVTTWGRHLVREHSSVTKRGT